MWSCACWAPKKAPEPSADPRQRHRCNAVACHAIRVLLVEIIEARGTAPLHLVIPADELLPQEESPTWECRCQALLMGCLEPRARGSPGADLASVNNLPTQRPRVHTLQVARGLPVNEDSVCALGLRHNVLQGLRHLLLLAEELCHRGRLLELHSLDERRGAEGAAGDLCCLNLIGRIPNHKQVHAWVPVVALPLAEELFKSPALPRKRIAGVLMLVVGPRGDRSNVRQRGKEPWQVTLTTFLHPIGVAIGHDQGFAKTHGHLEQGLDALLENLQLAQAPLCRVDRRAAQQRVVPIVDDQGVGDL
mmetsp:Transcript_73931/g.158442  ORF Transcript_73931/g.158442 Transcript_73931/m.158442 type:complete len:305 (+) Transcript_73931:29-943(+)